MSHPDCRLSPAVADAPGTMSLPCLRDKQPFPRDSLPVSYASFQPHPLSYLRHKFGSRCPSD